jgi:hypothetical protein
MQKIIIVRIIEIVIKKENGNCKGYNQACPLYGHQILK